MAWVTIRACLLTLPVAQASREITGHPSPFLEQIGYKQNVLVMGYNYAACTAIGVLFPVLAVFALSLRGYSHYRFSKKLDIDDYLIIPAFLLTVTAGVAITVGAQLGIIGGHSVPLTADEQNKLGKLEYAFWIGHVVTIGFIKLSILFFFRRLFKGRATRSCFDFANWTLIGLVIVWTLVFLLLDIFACGKYPNASWSSDYWRHDVCINTFAMMVSCAATNWIIDLFILAEPVIMIQKLQLLSIRKKIQASAVFLLSIFAVTAGLLRTVLWIQVNIGGHEKFIYSILGVNYPITDLEAIATVGLFWTYVEIGIGFLVACLLPSAKIIDALGPGRIFSRLRSSLSTMSPGRSRRSDSESDDDKCSEVSWETVVEPKRRNSLQHYDRELEFITKMDQFSDDDLPSHQRV